MNALFATSLHQPCFLSLDGFRRRRLNPSMVVLQFSLWSVLVIVSIELMNWAITTLPKRLKARLIEDKADPLIFTPRDRLFVRISKGVTVIWVYHFALFAYLSSHVRWSLREANLINTVIAVPL